MPLLSPRCTPCTSASPPGGDLSVRYESRAPPSNQHVRPHRVSVHSHTPHPLPEAPHHTPILDPPHPSTTGTARCVDVSAHPSRAMGWEVSLTVRIHLHPRCRAAHTRTRRETRSPSPSTPSVAVASPRHQGSTSRASSAFNHQSRRPSTHPERWRIPPPHGAAFTRTPAERGTFAALRHAPRVGGGLERATPRLQGCTGHLCQRSSVVSSRAHGREGTRVAAACGSRRARRLGLPGAAPLCTVRLHERAGRGRATMYSPWWQGTLRLSLVKRAASHVLRRQGAHRHTAETTERQDIYLRGRTTAR